MFRIRHIVFLSVKGGKHGVYTICQRRICIHKSMPVIPEEICQRHSPKSPFIAKHRIQKTAVFSRPFVSKKTPGYHYGVGSALFYRDFKRL